MCYHRCCWTDFFWCCFPDGKEVRLRSICHSYLPVLLFIRNQYIELETWWKENASLLHRQKHFLGSYISTLIVLDLDLWIKVFVDFLVLFIFMLLITFWLRYERKLNFQWILLLQGTYYSLLNPKFSLLLLLLTTCLAGEIFDSLFQVYGWLIH